MTTKKEQRFKRMDNVNEIIKTIANCGRGFFKNPKTGEISEFSFNHNDRITFFYAPNSQIIHPYPNTRNPGMGGTLWSLINQFRNYIMNNVIKDEQCLKSANGLFCPHWGYSEKDMETVRDKARELGYLGQDETAREHWEKIM